MASAVSFTVTGKKRRLDRSLPEVHGGRAVTDFEQAAHPVQATTVAGANLRSGPVYRLENTQPTTAALKGRSAITAYALITGTLFRALERRTSKAGKPFVTATIRAKDGADGTFWNIVAFSESAQSELIRLSEGEAMAVQGAMRIEEYEKDGQKRVSLSIVAHHALALRQSRKPPAHTHSWGCREGAKWPNQPTANASF
jgi:single-stranded DNA-binding protein